MIDVPLPTTTLVAAVPPRLTVAPDWNPVPVIVTPVPPLAGPELGPIPVTVGSHADWVLRSFYGLCFPNPHFTHPLNECKGDSWR